MTNFVFGIQIVGEIDFVDQTADHWVARWQHGQTAFSVTLWTSAIELRRKQEH
jgi:hypothetical protein